MPLRPCDHGRHRANIALPQQSHSSPIACWHGPSNPLKTSIPPQVVPLTALRQTIREWCERHGVAQPRAANAAANEAALAPLGPELQGLLASLRGGDVRLRGVAAGKINNMFIDWQRTPAILDMAEARTAAFKVWSLERAAWRKGLWQDRRRASMGDRGCGVGSSARPMPASPAHVALILHRMPCAREMHVVSVARR